MDIKLQSGEQRGASTSVRMLESEILTRVDVAAEDMKASKAGLLRPATMFGASLLQFFSVQRDLRDLRAVVEAPLLGY